METPNPYQAPNSPVEPIGDPNVLPTSAYISASLPAAFVFVGTTAGIGLFLVGPEFPLGFVGVMILASAPLTGIALGAVTFWEGLQVERRKRHKQYQAAHIPPGDEVPL